MSTSSLHPTLGRTAQPTPDDDPRPPAAPALHPGPRPVTPYEQHRTYVLSVLGRRCRWLEPSDREAILHDAYVVMLEKQHSGGLDTDAMRPAQVRAYLTQTSLNKALDNGKSAARRRSVPIEEDGRPLEFAADEPSVEDCVLATADRARVRALVAGLPQRQAQVIALRYFYDREPDEVRELLGLNARQYRRELERGKRAVRERFALAEADGLRAARAA